MAESVEAAVLEYDRQYRDGTDEDSRAFEALDDAPRVPVGAVDEHGRWVFPDGAEVHTELTDARRADLEYRLFGTGAELIRPPSGPAVETLVCPVCCCPFRLTSRQAKQQRRESLSGILFCSRSCASRHNNKKGSA